MKNLTLTGFIRTCDRLSLEKFIFDTDNQTDGGINDLKMMLFFSKVIVSLAPNCICFQGDGGVLRLDRVKSIQYDEGSDIPDLIFRIVCGNLEDDKDDKTYVITAENIF